MKKIAKVAMKKAMKAKKISKRMAKAVAFRGGNTHGGTSLSKADLVKNTTFTLSICKARNEFKHIAA